MDKEQALAALDTYREARGQLHRLVRAAHAAGATPTEIARRSGLTRAGVYKILNRPAKETTVTTDPETDFEYTMDDVRAEVADPLRVQICDVVAVYHGVPRTWALLWAVSPWELCPGCGQPASGPEECPMGVNPSDGDWTPLLGYDQCPSCGYRLSPPQTGVELDVDEVDGVRMTTAACLDAVRAACVELLAERADDIRAWEDGIRRRLLVQARALAAEWEAKHAVDPSVSRESVGNAQADDGAAWVDGGWEAWQRTGPEDDIRVRLTADLMEEQP